VLGAQQASARLRASSQGLGGRGGAESGFSYSSSSTTSSASADLDLLFFVALRGARGGGASPRPRAELEPYLRLLVPFAALALNSGARVGVELALDDESDFGGGQTMFADFTLARAPALAALADAAGAGRLLVRRIDATAMRRARSACVAESGNGGWAGSFVRFVERPQLSAQLTYICDSDILMLEPAEVVAAAHRRHMRSLSLPYSNSVRPANKQSYPGLPNRHLTGLQAVMSDAYYGGSAWTRAMLWLDGRVDGSGGGGGEQWGRDPAPRSPSDEVLLQRMMRAAGFGLPGESTYVAEDGVDTGAGADASAGAGAAGKASARRGTPPPPAWDAAAEGGALLEWRPVWGIHLSPNRGRGKHMALEASCAQCRRFEAAAARSPLAALLAAEDADAAGVARDVRALCACCTAVGVDDATVCRG
jgi:hypothetical protein